MNLVFLPPSFSPHTGQYGRYLVSLGIRVVILIFCLESIEFS